MKPLNASYLRNIIFGAEDSLVSTVGVLFGVATAYTTNTQVLLTGFIVIFVEALSMGVGSFLSETSANEIKRPHMEIYNPIMDGILMFFSYFVAGFIVLAPYAFIDLKFAKFVSFVVSVLALFILGALPTKNLKSGVRMVTLGSLAVFVGFFVAHILKPKEY